MHELVKAGLIDRPQARGYVTGAVDGMHDQTTSDSRATPLVDMLRAEPDWLRDELWRLFELEDAASHQPGEVEGLQGVPAGRRRCASWPPDGTVPRARLLDESLAALRRDFSPHAPAGTTSSTTHSSPRPKSMWSGSTSSWCCWRPTIRRWWDSPCARSESVERGERLPAEDLFEAIPPALLLPVKGHATRAVKLAGRVLKRSPEAARLATPPLVETLAHEARDVQEAVLDVLERHRDLLSHQDCARIVALTADVDASVQTRAAAFGAAAATAARAPSAGPAIPVPGRRPIARDTPRLSTAQPLVAAGRRQPSCSTGWRSRSSAGTIRTSSSSCSTGSAGCAATASIPAERARWSSGPFRWRGRGSETSASTTRATHSPS